MLLEVVKLNFGILFFIGASATKNLLEPGPNYIIFTVGKNPLQDIVDNKDKKIYARRKRMEILRKKKESKKLNFYLLYCMSKKY